MIYRVVVAGITTVAMLTSCPNQTTVTTPSTSSVAVAVPTGTTFQLIDWTTDTVAVEPSGDKAQSFKPEQVVRVPTGSTSLPKINPLLTRSYPMYSRSPAVVQLQMILGMKSVDGIYGPQTRGQHIAALGGPAEALGYFHPELERLSSSPGQSLGELIDLYFKPADRSWARKVAFCESSAQTHDTYSSKVSSALAVGWFQHLAKFWLERSAKAGVPTFNPFDPEANVAVASWLFYEGGGERHWYPSRKCWEAE